MTFNAHAVVNTTLDLTGDIQVSELKAALEETKLKNSGQLPYEMAVQLDRLQQHSPARDGGLNAKKTRKGQGFEAANPQATSAAACGLAEQLTSGGITARGMGRARFPNGSSAGISRSMGTGGGTSNTHDSQAF